LNISRQPSNRISLRLAQSNCFGLISPWQLFCNENELDNAQSHIERAKSHAIDDAYKLGRAMDLQAEIWYRQGRLEEAKAEILRALETFEKTRGYGGTTGVQIQAPED
jgi:tetratricopeptide (TPR) repeat protein